MKAISVSYTDKVVETPITYFLHIHWNGVP